MSTTIYTSNGKILINGSNNKWLKAPAVVPFGPTHVELADGVIRIRVTPGSVPTAAGGPPGFVATNVEGDIWDCSLSGYEAYLFQYSNIKDIAVDIIDWHIKDSATSLDQNLRIGTGWTNLKRINVSYCSHLTTLYSSFTSTSIEELYLSNTSSITNMTEMCKGASSLKMIPYIEDVTALTECLSAFNGCVNVESGITSMYDRLSAVSGVSDISTHYQCFKDCGSNTIAGAAELANVPSGWK